MRLALIACLAALPALAEPSGRPDLSSLTEAQRGVFAEVAKEVFTYAGCQDTLAACLAAQPADPHAVRMATLVRQLASEGFPARPIIQTVEQYYASFATSERFPVQADGCAVRGQGPIVVVEFSDYQCPHCAAVLEPLEALVDRDRKGQVKLCSKYFPLSSHPRAFVAAACAEYARGKGKFWELNALLFANREALEDDNLKEYAKRAGLDGNEMLRKVYAGDFDGAVEKSRRQGLALGVESTPTLFVDGRHLALPPRPWYLAFTVDDELAWKKEKGWSFGGAAQGRAGR